MNFSKLKKIGSVFLIIIGVVALISELASSEKNYYVQSIGFVCLMIGLYTINSKLESKKVKDNFDFNENSEEY